MKRKCIIRLVSIVVTTIMAVKFVSTIIKYISKTTELMDSIIIDGSAVNQDIAKDVIEEDDEDVVYHDRKWTNTEGDDEEDSREWDSPITESSVS